MPRNKLGPVILPSLAKGLVATGLVCALPLFSVAETSPKNQVEAVEQQMKAEQDRTRDLENQARSLSQELEGLRLQLITTAHDTQEREALVDNLEVQIEDLEAEIETRKAVLQDRHAQLAGTLAALTGLSEDAPRAFFLYPGSPVEAVRGSILLQAAAPVIARRARILRDDLAALEAVRVDLTQKREQLIKEDAALAADRDRLETLIARKRDLYQRTADQAQAANQRLRDLTAKAQSLKELMEALESERVAREAEEAARLAAEKAARAAEEAVKNPQDAPQQAPATTADQASQLAALAVAPTVRPDGVRTFPSDGVITPPSTGILVQTYGQDTGFGATSKGIVVETRPLATVLAPYDGKAVFAGPFRDLGQVLIIEHDGGYHTVLAGFAKIDVGIGDWVLAGEPVGMMPQHNESATDITGGIETGGDSRPRLYMELRRDGQPVNPLRWITAGSIRVNG